MPQKRTRQRTRTQSVRPPPRRPIPRAILLDLAKARGIKNIAALQAAMTTVE